MAESRFDLPIFQPLEPPSNASDLKFSYSKPIDSELTGEKRVNAVIEYANTMLWLWYMGVEGIEEVLDAVYDKWKETGAGKIQLSDWAILKAPTDEPRPNWDDLSGLHVLRFRQPEFPSFEQMKKDFQEVREQFEKEWNDPKTGAGMLRKQLEETEYPSEITKIDVPGNSNNPDMKKDDRKKVPAMRELAFTLCIRDLLSYKMGSKAIKLFIQNLSYTQVEKKFLEDKEYGFTVLDGALNKHEGLVETDNSTFVLCGDARAPIETVVCDIARPVAMMWGGVQKEQADLGLPLIPRIYGYTVEVGKVRKSITLMGPPLMLSGVPILPTDTQETLQENYTENLLPHVKHLTPHLPDGRTVIQLYVRKS
ncbi:hypothetical protein F4779DRAFT_623568 [Xylariaceae sp. FL0662B]|nr:hypothetical protein F4779DRAFT_623568 [Xylariaceae sp. FL0662B]